MSAQTEVRYDALSDRTVIVATGRDARPHQFRAPDGEPDPGTEHCPFCPGHEAMTPPEVARTGERRARHTRLAGAGGAQPLPHRRHRTRSWCSRPTTTARSARSTTPRRSRCSRCCATVSRSTSSGSGGHATAVAILNHKREAGASLPHPHAQVLATDFVPPAIAGAVGRAERAATDLVRRRPRHATRRWCSRATPRR